MALNLKIVYLGLSVLGAANSSFRCSGNAKTLTENYIRTAERPPEIAAALHRGKVILGMTTDDVLLAAGIKAGNYRNYGFYLVRDGKLYIPPTIALQFDEWAIITKNKTQYDSPNEIEFTIYFREKIVVEVSSRKPVFDR